MKEPWRPSVEKYGSCGVFSFLCGYYEIIFFQGFTARIIRIHEKAFGRELIERVSAVFRISDVFVHVRRIDVAHHHLVL